MLDVGRRGFVAAAPCKVCAKKRLDDSLLEQGPQEKEVGDETKCMVDPPASRLGRILAVLPSIILDKSPTTSLEPEPGGRLRERA